MNTPFARPLRLFGVVLALASSAVVPAAAPSDPPARSATELETAELETAELEPAELEPAELEAELGADLFYRRCSVCHGKTGLGLEEARAAFPESHRRCTQCHKSGGPQLLMVPFNDNNMFDVGTAPALRGPGTLPAFSDSASLRRYIQAAMPRHAPGSLTEAEAAAITAFIEELRGQ